MSKSLKDRLLDLNDFLLVVRPVEGGRSCSFHYDTVQEAIKRLGPYEPGETIQGSWGRIFLLYSLENLWVLRLMVMYVLRTMPGV